MTLKQIEEKQAQENVMYEAAKKIRLTLDEAREAYGAETWDENDMDSAVVEMVTAEMA